MALDLIDDDLMHILMTREKIINDSMDNYWFKTYSEYDYHKIRSWLLDNCRGNYRMDLNKKQIWFENKEDQILFIMTWR